jgi:hypothetical protein
LAHDFAHGIGEVPEVALQPRSLAPGRGRALDCLVQQDIGPEPICEPLVLLFDRRRRRAGTGIRSRPRARRSARSAAHVASIASARSRLSKARAMMSAARSSRLLFAIMSTH